ncbi:uncharacterized protein LOC143223165 [Tachypleus tridentatus]|uniref:uncharacterized protein LOC143223165 n=1 Tax=Tachypleus tridentatus TaxID=6853 RepID=UPI003FD11CA1
MHSSQVFGYIVHVVSRMKLVNVSCQVLLALLVFLEYFPSNEALIIPLPIFIPIVKTVFVGRKRSSPRIVYKEVPVIKEIPVYKEVPFFDGESYRRDGSGVAALYNEDPNNGYLEAHGSQAGNSYNSKNYAGAQSTGYDIKHVSLVSSNDERYRGNGNLKNLNGVRQRNRGKTIGDSTGNGHQGITSKGSHQGHMRGNRRRQQGVSLAKSQTTNYIRRANQRNDYISQKAQGRGQLVVSHKPWNRMKKTNNELKIMKPTMHFPMRTHPRLAGVSKSGMVRN